LRFLEEKERENSCLAASEKAKKGWVKPRKVFSFAQLNTCKLKSQYGVYVDFAEGGESPASTQQTHV
jgi:hypothetical protein